MDTSFTIKPPAGVPKLTPRDTTRARDAVATDLDAAKSVTAADGNTDHRDRRQEHLPHDVVADPESREVINRENDVRAQTAEREHPDQALARLRAYRPVRTETEPPATTEPHANIKA